MPETPNKSRSRWGRFVSIRTKLIFLAVGLYLISIPGYLLLLQYGYTRMSQALDSYTEESVAGSLAAFLDHTRSLLAYKAILAADSYPATLPGEHTTRPARDPLSHVYNKLREGGMVSQVVLVNGRHALTRGLGDSRASTLTVATGRWALDAGSPTQGFVCEGRECQFLVAAPVSMPAGTNSLHRDPAALVMAVSLDRLLEAYGNITGRQVSYSGTELATSSQTLSAVDLGLPDTFRLVVHSDHSVSKLLDIAYYLPSMLGLAGPAVLAVLFAILLHFRLAGVRQVLARLPRLTRGEEREFAKFIESSKPALFPDELDTLRAHLGCMALQLAEFRERGAKLLESAVREEEHARQKAEQAQLVAQFISATEEGRRALATELHDELGQLLTSVRIDLSALSSRVCPEAEPRQLLDRLDSTVKASQHSLHALVESLRPGVIDTLGLEGGISAMLQEWHARSPACRMALNTKGDLSTLPESLTVALYRITQEAVTNAMKHSRASSLTVGLAADDVGVTLTVTDNGIGYDVTAGSGRHGILGMRERVAAFKGTFELGNTPEKGCRLAVWLPLHPFAGRG